MVVDANLHRAGKPPYRLPAFCLISGGQKSPAHPTLALNIVGLCAIISS